MSHSWHSLIKYKVRRSGLSTPLRSIRWITFQRRGVNSDCHLKSCVSLTSVYCDWLLFSPSVHPGGFRSRICARPAKFLPHKKNLLFSTDMVSCTGGGGHCHVGTGKGQTQTVATMWGKTDYCFPISLQNLWTKEQSFRSDILQVSGVCFLRFQLSPNGGEWDVSRFTGPS